MNSLPTVAGSAAPRDRCSPVERQSRRGDGRPTTDIQGSNGVIHVIDAVMIPPAGTATPTSTPTSCNGHRHHHGSRRHDDGRHHHPGDPTATRRALDVLPLAVGSTRRARADRRAAALTPPPFSDVRPSGGRFGSRARRESFPPAAKEAGRAWSDMMDRPESLLGARTQLRSGSFARAPGSRRNPVPGQAVIPVAGDRHRRRHRRCEQRRPDPIICRPRRGQAVFHPLLARSRRSSRRSSSQSSLLSHPAEQYIWRTGSCRSSVGQRHLLAQR